MEFNPNNIEDVIQYRVLDTFSRFIFLANYFCGLPGSLLKLVYLEKSIEANRNYLKQISLFYNKKEVPTSYRLARKHAFIEVGNLMASFQECFKNLNQNKVN
jgi:hypothetical protein